MRSGAGGWASALLLLAIGAMARQAAGPAANRQKAVPPEAKGVQVAYFYKPPLDGTPARFLARHFSLIILTENDEGYARQLRQDGYRGRILRYVDAGEVEGPGPYWRRPRQCDRAYQPYQYSLADRAGIFCRDINPHENWFLHDPQGRRILSRFRSAGGIWRTNYAMNPAAAGWRRFAAGRLQAERRLGYDGIFLDNIALSRAGWLADEAGPRGIRKFRNDAAWRRAMAGFLAAIHRALGPVPIWANLTHDPNTPGDWRSYLPDLNGVMVEDFLFGWRSYALDPRGRRGQWENIRMALAAGHSVLLVAQGGREQHCRLRTALAGYWLLRPQPEPRARLFFRYADAGDGAYRTVWWYRLYRQSPGRAMGPARRHGGSWERRFTDGTVRLDLRSLGARLPQGRGGSTRGRGDAGTGR